MDICTLSALPVFAWFWIRDEHPLSLLSGAVALADGQAETTVLTGIDGERLCLITGLQDFDHVILYFSSDKRVVLNFDNGTLVKNESERFKMELSDKNGSVLISPLTVSDTGEYTLEITYVDNSRNTRHYEINVTSEYFGIITSVVPSVPKEVASSFIQYVCKKEKNFSKGKSFF